MVLKNSDHTIKEVACEFGFEDPAYFSRWFKTRIGSAPSLYRESLELGEEG